MKRIEIKCPQCSGSYTDDNPIQMIFTSVPDLIAHLQVHKRLHLKAPSFMYWLYNKLKELKLIDRYMTWETWNFEFIKWSNYFFPMYESETRNTCRNIPCWQCQIDSTNKVIAHNVIKKEIKRRGYIQRPHGRKELLPEMDMKL